MEADKLRTLLDLVWMESARKPGSRKSNLATTKTKHILAELSIVSSATKRGICGEIVRSWQILNYLSEENLEEVRMAAAAKTISRRRVLVEINQTARRLLVGRMAS